MEYYFWIPIIETIIYDEKILIPLSMILRALRKEKEIVHMEYK